MLALILSFFTKKYIFIDGIPKYIFGENPNIPAFLFMAVIVSLFLGLVVSAEEIFKDRKILKREKFLNLSRSSYLFSKIIILFSLSAIQALIFVLIGNSMLEIKGMVFRYWLILFTTSCWANMIGLNISSGLNSVVTIYILVPLILVPQLLFSGVVVDFNNMYNKTATKKNVPLIGNMMTSRWAYEAITVTQFKDNSFEKIFYKPEAKIKNAIYYRSYCIPELRRTAGDCSEQTTNADTTKKLENLKLIRNELTKLALFTGWSKPVFFDSLYVKRFTQNTCNSLNDYLDGAEKYFIMLYNDGVSERELKYEQLVKKLGSEKKFNAFKSACFNNQLASVVTNEKDFQAYDIQNNEIRRLKDAVYHEPISIYGNAHYYAPLKKIGLVKIDTFWYNMAVIWLFSIVLFVVLYYDILRKVIAYFEAIRLNRANRRRFLRLLNITDPQNFSGKQN